MEASDNLASITLQVKNQSMGSANNFLSTLIYAKYPLVQSPTNRGTIGINYAKDQILEPGHLTFQTFNFTFAYSFLYNRLDGIAFAFDVGIVSQKIDLAGIQTGEMWTPDGFDATRPSGENFFKEKVTHPNFNGSTFWFSRDRYQDIDGYLGISFFGLNKVHTSFFEDKIITMNQFLKVLGGVRLIEQNRSVLMPKFLIARDYTNTELRLGVDFNYSLAQYSFGTSRRDNSLNFELNYVRQRGIQIGMQLSKPSYVIGIGYNLNFNSDIQYSGFNNAVEALIVVRNPIEFLPANKRKLPKSKKRKRKAGESVTRTKSKKDKMENKSLDVDSTTIIVNDLKIEEKHPEEDVDILREDVELPVSWKSMVTFGEFRGIGFEFNSTTITKETKPALENMVELMANNSAYYIVLVGHTDNVGSASVNDKISFGRANAVAKMLVELGVENDRIILEWKGEEEPLAPNDREEGRAKNRRVEFYIVEVE